MSWSRVRDRGCENQRGNVFLTAVHLHQLPANPPEIFPSTVTGLACAPGVQTTSCPLALWEYLFVSPGQLAATPGLLLLPSLLPVLKQDSSCKGRCESLSRHEEAVIKAYVTVNNCSRWPCKRLLHGQPQYHMVSWGKTSANTWALSRCHIYPHIHTKQTSTLSIKTLCVDGSGYIHTYLRLCISLVHLSGALLLVLCHLLCHLHMHCFKTWPISHISSPSLPGEVEEITQI